jgi:NAD(P)-dependent dehydrogenase (short-subunit alcohol dehydrogenase family)
MLTLCLAQELGARGVRVCAVHPGRLLTDSASADADMPPLQAAERFAE